MTFCCQSLRLPDGRGREFVLRELRAVLDVCGRSCVSFSLSSCLLCFPQPPRRPEIVCARWTEPVVPELSRPLGAPLGPAVSANVTFTPPGASSSKKQYVTSWERSFGKGTRAQLNISQAVKFDAHHDVWCCIWWSDGSVSECPHDGPAAC